MTPREAAADARTALFVPGTRPDRFGTALAAGADLVIADLEDAVADADKDTAREHVRDLLGGGDPVAVRINAAGTPWYDADVAMLRGHGAVVVLPKAETAEQVGALAAALPGAPLIPLVETAVGVLGAAEVCRAESVVRPAFGSVDLAAELGVDHTDREALRHARSALVLAAAAAGTAAPLDGVTTAVRDAALLDADLRHAARLGFTGKLCLHPAQLEPVRRGFAPSAEELTWARAVVAAAGDGGVAVLDGRMVDKPVVERARRLLRAG
ncbi:CoA ester lyase [Saccharopolyspora cebuensis]|uniref:CoA ester lyase n=1 Tax=Saccharopolyspora cebuensis TaxID=418759 RepID=A0ABV4CEG5_9PSEU